MRTKMCVALATSVACAGAALAGGSISDGDAQFDLLFNPVFSTTFGDSNLRTDAGGLDQISKYTWYYRTPNNNFNRIFSDLDTPAENYSGDTATIQYTNAGPGPAGFERFNADFQIVIEDGPGMGQAIVNCTLVVQNVSTQTRTFQFFNLVDADVDMTAADDTVEVTDAGAVIARTSDAGGGFVEHLGVNATFYEVDAGAPLRNKVNAGAFDLDNDGDPVSGDVASAMQWSVTLAPMEFATIISAVAVNRSALTGGPCSPADITTTGACTPGMADGAVDLSDFSCYLSLWSASNALADITTTGVCTPGAGGDGVDLSDFSCYLSVWSSGCP